MARTRQEFKALWESENGDTMRECVCPRVCVCFCWGGGLHREGKGTSLSAPPEGWNSSQAVPPIWQALVKTIPQLLVTLQIQ